MNKDTSNKKYSKSDLKEYHVGNIRTMNKDTSNKKYSKSLKTLISQR